MATLTFNSFNQAIADLMNKQHNLGSDALKIMLTNTAPSASNTVTSDITEISAGNGYTAGGAAVTISSSSQTSGTYTLVAGANVTFAASGGSIGPFRYAVLYNSVNSKLLSYYDRGSALTLSDGGSYVLNINGNTLLTGTLS